MRIVAGKFRAKRLTPPSHDIRPTLDKVKQALFTRLQFEIEDARVLDLFCGSGALGIEALSRDAKKVVFCDVDNQSISLTKQNIAGLKIGQGQEVKVYKTDYLKYLRGVKEQFDIIVLDPPYDKNFYLPALEVIFQNNILASDGVIVCERLKNKKITQDFFDVECIKEYGSVALDYLIWKNN